MIIGLVDRGHFRYLFTGVILGSMWLNNLFEMDQMRTDAIVAEIEVKSTAFRNGDPLPSVYTCDGKNVNPPISISKLPSRTKSLAIIVDDPDAPVATWVHWIAWNIPVTRQLKENEVVGMEGLNDFQQRGYVGPCPPSGEHHYFFKVYALDKMLDLPPDTQKRQLEKAMRDHILGYGQLMGTYKRSS